MHFYMIRMTTTMKKKNNKINRMEINRNKQNDTNSTILFYTQSNKYKIIFLQ